MKKLYTVFLIALVFHAYAQTPDAKLIKEFDAYIEKSRKQYDVPGLRLRW